MRAQRFSWGGQRMMVVSGRIGSPVVGDLTSAEREVCGLVEQGLSNAAIASTRGTSVRTVANQLRSIYRKLGVGGRRELISKLSCSAAGAATAAKGG